MIFVRDKGQMCNNILQYGHVYAWGREHGRTTMSMRFAYKYQYFHICKSRHHNFLTYIFAKYGAKTGLINVITLDKEEDVRTEVEQQMLSHRMMIIEGWYARWYDLFIKYKQEIIQLFAFNDEIEHRVNNLLDDKLRLGLHIRRGDYKAFLGGRFFYTDEQYINIVRGFLALHPKQNIHIYICGNDPKLNKELYVQQLPGCQVSFPNGNPGEDLCLLSHCDYLIGAPSTFSLVAAMYHDLPLYWIEDPNQKVSQDSFKHFDYLFRHIY